MKKFDIAQLVERQSHDLEVASSNLVIENLGSSVSALLAQSVERKPFKLVVVGSSPTFGII